MKNFTRLTAIALFAIVISISASASAQNNSNSGPNPASLKYKLHSFTGAAKNNNTVVLNWVTDNELNNGHYEIERSFDGKNYKSVGLVLDGFEDGAHKNYGFKDNSLSASNSGVVYYRLKQVDKDGKFSYTTGDVVTITMNNVASRQEMVVGK